MLKRRNWLLVLVLVLALSFMVTGCKDDDNNGDEPTAEILMNYLEDNNMDLTDVLSGWTISASSIVDNLSEYYIMDIRSETDYNAGHIDGAILSSLGNILVDAADDTDNLPIVVVCKSGQTAGHAVMALRLSGYSDAAVLLWGMSGWNSDFDIWTGHLGNTAVGSAGWSMETTPAADVEYGYPEISSSSTDGATILAAQVDAMLAGGFQTTTNTEVLDNYDSYFVNNYWAQTDFEYYGHITDCHRIKEDLSLAADGFRYLDPMETIVTYCWTGQTSSMVTAYLTVLGYDAKSLVYGANGLIFDNLEAHTFPGAMEYDYVTEPTM